jgi:hypothetical protein
MTEFLAQLAVLAVALVVIGFVLHAALAPRYQFMIKIRAGEPKVVHGKVSAEFLDRIREVCSELNISTGWIGGVKRGSTIALRFSRNFPPSSQQRLRNAWFSP